jgi:hypothetical protein
MPSVIGMNQVTHCQPFYCGMKEFVILILLCHHAPTLRQPQIILRIFLPNMISFEIAVGNK